jgi:DNA-binding MarR family transcriptional regulator
MSFDLDCDKVAADLLGSIGELVRRARQVPLAQGLSMPERSALSLLERTGPAASSALARQAQITAQSMGATLAALRERGLVERQPDPQDGRRAVLSVTKAGRKALADKRNARSEQMAAVLRSGEFTPAELERLASAAPLIERLARHL